VTDIDVFGNIIDAEWVEDALRDTLQAWLPGHLAHQERRRDLDPGYLQRPTNWPTISEFEMDNSRHIPAIIIVSPGSLPNPKRNQKGEYTKTWRFEIAAVVGDRTEAEARKLGSLYLAAVIGALVQNRTLGGRVKDCRYMGPDDHAFGTNDRKRTRAIYGTAFEVDVRVFVNDRLGPTSPPPDPFDPPDPPLNALEAQITVDYLEDETP
jgi:hypothetical protein